MKRWSTPGGRGKAFGSNANAVRLGSGVKTQKKPAKPVKLGSTKHQIRGVQRLLARVSGLVVWHAHMSAAWVTE